MPGVHKTFAVEHKKPRPLKSGVRQREFFRGVALEKYGKIEN